MPIAPNLLVSPSTCIIEAMRRIDQGASQIVLVVDEAQRLLGTVTDGDVRRAILRGVDLNSTVAAIMNEHPLAVAPNVGHDAVFALMRTRKIHQVPVLDAEGSVLDLITLDAALRALRQETLVVLMAGGLGSRLYPLTETTPKPLLHVGGRPLIETTITTLARQGFGRFMLAVNYKAEMFQSHFGSGEQIGVEIDYLHEKEKLGTAGALRLLKERPTAPLLVMNGDILTNLDARRLVTFHRELGRAATMCVSEYEWQVPYGVVQLENGLLAGFEEKPKRREFVNAGIYLLSPNALDYIPESGAVDMPTLLSLIAAQLGPPAIYPLKEYWLDIGRLDDFQRAQNDIHLFQ